MIKLFKQICLCGILLTNINCELVYSSQNVILRTVGEAVHSAQQPPRPDPELQPSSPDLTQFNPQLVLNNEPVTDTTQLVLDSNKIISGINILGKYDTSKFYIEDNTLYPVLCELDPNAGNYGVFTNDGYNINNLAVPYTGTTTYNYNDYIVFPMNDGIMNIYYSVDNYSGLNILRKVVMQNGTNEYINIMIKDLYIYNADFTNNYIYNADFTNNILVHDISGINIMCVQILSQKYPDSKYKLSGDNLKILYNQPLAKFDSETKKWYGTDGLGEYKVQEGTEDEKIELNKVILNIPSNKNLTLKENEEPTSLEVTEFGKLINNGTIEAQNNTSIYGQKALFTIPELEKFLFCANFYSNPLNKELFSKAMLVTITAFDQTFDVLINNEYKITNINGVEFDTPETTQTIDGIEIKYNSGSEQFEIKKGETTINIELDNIATDKLIDGDIAKVNGETIFFGRTRDSMEVYRTESIQYTQQNIEEVSTVFLFNVTDLKGNKLYSVTAKLPDETYNYMELVISDEEDKKLYTATIGIGSLAEKII